MTKTVWKAIAFALLLCLLFCFTSCDPEIVHEHSSDGTLQHDSAFHWKVCSECGERFEIVPHSFEHHDGKVATCTEAGHSEYDTCECGYTTCQVIPALGHDFAQYTSDGNATHLADGTKTATCSRCTVTDTQPDAGSRIAEHTYDQKVVSDAYLKSAATCTDAAVYYKSCACGEKGSETFTNGDPLNHDLVHHDAQAATCTAVGRDAYDTCSRCDYTTYVEKPALNHDLVHHEAQAATCTAVGWEAYDTCSRCTYTTYVEKPALNHDIVHHDAQAATCTAVGWDAYDTCSRCDYSTYVEIPVLGHDIAHHDAQAATCTAVGWDAYDTCSRCTYTTYVEKPALNHDLVHHEAQAATCTAVGWDAYDTCSRCDYTTYVEKPALNHDIVHHDAQAATCTAVGWDAYDTCSRCDYTTYVEKPALNHDIVHHEAQAATCTAVGWDAFDTCSRCDYTTYVEKPALGHEYGDWIAQVNATCTADGTKGHYHCSACDKDFDSNHVEIDNLTIASPGHTYGDWIAQVDATCAATGTLAHYHCSACGKDFDSNHVEIDNLTIASPEHTYGDWIAQVNATCTTDGVKAHYHCSACGKDFDSNHVEIADLTIASLGHDVDSDHYICQRCGLVPAIGTKGPAGGLIFYDVDADNGSGNADGLESSTCGWRYLEASPSDIWFVDAIYTYLTIEQFFFGYYRTSSEGENLYVNGTTTYDEYCTGTAIGTGKTNTQKLVSAMGEFAYLSEWFDGGMTSDYAAKLCDDYEYGGYSDWFLPSLNELSLMYTNLKQVGLGSFDDYYYWSSSEKDGTPGNAWYIDFEDGRHLTMEGGDVEFRVRPVRAF